MHARTLSFLFLSMFLGLLVVGCGDDKGTVTPPPPPPKELPQPLLTLLAPTQVAAGDVITLFGQGFASPDVGEPRLRFLGVYQTSEGAIEEVDLEVVPTRVTDRELAWTFGPNIPFSKLERTGSFRGTVQVSNVGLDGQVKSAQPYATQIAVRPSILIRQFRPVDANCAVGITDSIENAAFVVEVEVVGLKAGNSVAPLRYVYTFMKEQFQFEGYVGGTLGLDPETLFPKSGPVTVVDDVRDGTKSLLGSSVPRDTWVEGGSVTDGGISSIAKGADNLFKLSTLKTAPLSNPAADSQSGTILVRAVDSTGAMAKRTLPLRIWAAVEVDYQGGHKVVRSYDPVPVSGCIDGGDIGRDVTYSESSSETRARGFKVINKTGAAVDVVVARLNAEFGVEVTSDVSSSEAQSLQFSGKILPNEYAVFYRQTLQMERTATLRGHGPCGATQNLGEVVVTDWTWSPDLAKGNVCPPLPPSNLKPGQIFE